MKLTALLLLLSLCGYSTSDSLRIPQQKQGSLKTNPFVIVMGGLPLASEYRVMYELTTGFRVSQQIGFSYLGRTILYPALAKSIDSNYTYDVVFRGFRFQYMYRIFIGRDEYAPEGWYFGPVASYAMGRLSLGNLMAGGRYIEFKQGYACMAFGRQARVGTKFVYDFYMGMGYKRNQAIEHYPNHLTKTITWDDPGLDNFYNSRFKFCTGVNFGFLF